MSLFQQSVLKKHIESFDASHIEERWSLFKNIFLTTENQKNIKNGKKAGCEIDEMVYELYGLSEEEIRIVEQA